MFNMMPPDAQQQQQTAMPRDVPEPDDARAALVKRWTAAVARQKKCHAPAYRRMREDMDFAWGIQWHNQTPSDDRYIANIVQSHLRTRVSALYARNPTVIARRRHRLDFALWDENPESAMNALATVQQVGMAAMVDPAAAAMVAQAQAVLQDIQQGFQQRRALEKTAKTLKIYFDHCLKEQVPHFKRQMKRVVRRTLTAGVGYVKLDFMRDMRLPPDTEARVADLRNRLATVNRLAADLADGERDPLSAEAAELKQTIASLQAEPMQTVREGLVFNYPRSTSIIPGPGCRDLVEFVGAPWVAEEFLLTPDQVKEVFEVDLAKKFVRHTTEGRSEEDGSIFSPERVKAERDSLVAVWEIYDKASGRVYFVADGYPDFLREPEDPPIRLERFYPWYGLVFNEHEDEEERHLFPQSDVRLLRHIQREYNRKKEALRQHRIANRPLYANAAGTLDETDQESLAHHPAHGVIQLQGLQPGQNVGELLQAVQKIGIDPNVYETNGDFEDMQRVVGSQEANLGGTSGATATESSIAENSRLGDISSYKDDLDTLLTEIARDGGQVALLNVSRDTVTRIVGRGAAWPELRPEDVADEIQLEILAGSSGRPNQTQEVATLERMTPLLVQVPGIRPDWLARKMLETLDQNIDLTDAYLDGLPSIMSMNRMTQPGTGDPGSDPTAQGGEGGDNAERAGERPGGPAPENPAPGQATPDGRAGQV